MIFIKDAEKDTCCGCRACEQICPKKCIDMHNDSEGFKYPLVREDECIHCDRCDKVCPIIQKDIENMEPREKDKSYPRVYGGWNTNMDERMLSSSGGVFTVFANYILTNGGVVYGARVGDDMTVHHVAVENKEGLDILRGSKYVQSDTLDTYSQILSHLKEDRAVLFTGAPCQVAGLQTFLGKEYSNLYTCDFICHGVPSPKVFAEYVKYLGVKYKDAVTHIKFRTKLMKWNQSGLQMGTLVTFKSGKQRKFMPAFKDSFMNGFLSDIYLRPACYNCRFKEKSKDFVDITIADFWGVAKDYPQLNSEEGTSLMLINTEKGQELFDKTKVNIHHEECEFEKALRRNSSLYKSVKMVKERDAFYKMYEKKGFEKAMKRYMNAAQWFVQKVMIKLGWR